ncbi:Clp protease N-terminal domain-containing protein [Ktedonobacter sp. SOSP1-52]|uniref:Clp protease N-terminal domain-containing protein n=1 Tax=Ktedonobacter sp. SOSP1-52 TaxID=2778366 RepID=UPI0019155938|nr:Clp protease N-terminal domain-containing protein [Ktedonobacter sp. SOSP1-52]
MTQQGKASLELAVQEARSLGHHYLGTEHLLLGILREEIEDLASQVLLTASGVTLDKAREQVKQLLASE